MKYACFEGERGRFMVREDQIIHVFHNEEGLFYGVENTSGAQLPKFGDWDTEGPFRNHFKVLSLVDGLNWVAEWKGGKDNEQSS